MDKKIIKFDDTEIKEYKFYQNKSSIVVNDVNINKIVVFNKLFFGKQDFKYFIDYKHCYYLIKKEKFFIKYIEILEKVRNIIKKNLKELRNCILCIICVWSLFCSIQVYTSQHFLSILFGN